MSHDDLSGRTGGPTGGLTGGWTTAPGLDDALRGFAGEVRIGRDAGAITDELIESLSDADQRQLLEVLTRHELLRRAGHEVG